MARAARIQDGTAVEIVDLLTGFTLADSFPPDSGWVDAPEGAVVGMTFSDGLFGDPPAGPAMSDADVIAAVRAQRDGLLAMTDMMVAVPDWPMTEPQRSALISYRQALRDLTDQPISYGSIPWPTWPAGLNPPPGLTPPTPIG